VPSSPKLYRRSYPIPEGISAHVAAVEEEGWDGFLFTATKNLSMDVFGSLYIAASATSPLVLGTAALESEDRAWVEGTSLPETNIPVWAPWGVAAGADRLPGDPAAVLGLPIARTSRDGVLGSWVFDLAAAPHDPHHHQQRRRHRQPSHPDHRPRRNDPRGVVEGVAAVLWLLAVAEYREVCSRFRERRGLATEIDLKMAATSPENTASELDSARSALSF
jgi:hypothetical protein